jgi:hypothetical protein
MGAINRQRPLPVGFDVRIQIEMAHKLTVWRARIGRGNIGYI